MKTLALIGMAVFALSVTAHAQGTKDKKKSGDKKSMAVDLGLPSFGAIPKGEELQADKPKAGLEKGPSTTSFDAKYEVVSVVHARSFMKGAGGSSPVGGAMGSITLSGNPPSTEKFQTVVRVKSPQRANAAIDVAILDPRGDTAMSASGQLIFRTPKQDEADWTVEWDPTPCRSGGDFQVLVRIAGQVMGTWPLKVVQK